jgi:23S rRNA (cytidine1920-2'-O)/16S rRNA (cytidine1409-2'-O)-methyltransferase
MAQSDCLYVSRGGLKLAAALDRFQIDPAGWRCADLGCSVGGFSDCLLLHGAEYVYAVDTAYGDLAWTLRQDSRITVLERTNALHFDPAGQLTDFTGCDLVTLDLGWTRQQKAIPAALRWLGPSRSGLIITLVKPHYQQAQPSGPTPRKGTKGKNKKKRGDAKIATMSEEEAKRVLERTLAALREFQVEPVDWCRSPITGSKGGNVEYLALLRPV